MPINKDDIQDDYYASISQTTENTAWDKKTLKIKPKVVLKKPTEPISTPVEEPVSKPKIIARKVEKTEPIEVPPVVEATPEIVAAPPVVQVPASAIPSPPAPKPRKRDAVDQEIQSLFEKFSSHPIESIPRAISIAKRFEFQSEFFDGDAQAYNKFMQDVDAAGSRDAAFEVYHAAKAKYTWENDDLRDELKALLYRKYV